MAILSLLVAASVAASSNAFVAHAPSSLRATRLNGFSDDYGWGTDVARRKERDARMEDRGDRVVEVKKPFQVIMEEDKNGDVFIAEVNPGGNGARAGLKPGEKIVMVSATFGNELWNVNGAGISRVKKAIQVRAGPTCRVVVQNKEEMLKKQKENAMSEEAKLKRFLVEQKKRESLLSEIKEERQGAVGGGFGLFKKNFGLWGNDEPQ